MADKYTFDTGGGSSSVMVRLVDGQVAEEESERIPYDPIPKGQYNLEITGFQAPFEMPRSPLFPKEEWQSDTVTKTRLEFTVIDGPHAGAAFTCLYTLSFGDRAALGQLLRAVHQGPLPRRFSLVETIGWSFAATVIHAKDKQGQVKLGRDGNPFPDIVTDTVEPLSSDHPAPPAAAKKPAPKASPAMQDDPRISWTALWNALGRWGVSNVKDAEKLLKRDLAKAGPGDIYEAVMAHVGEPVEEQAPF